MSQPTISPNETNPATHDQIRGLIDSCRGEIVGWNDSRLRRILRLRLLSDPGFPAWDVSYCYGELKDGTVVQVQLPFSQLMKRKSINSQIVQFAKKDGVFAKGLEIFNAISTLN